VSYFNSLLLTSCGFGKSYLYFLQKTRKQEELVLASFVLSSALGGIYGLVLCLFDHLDKFLSLQIDSHALFSTAIETLS